ncbi:hypothetical protein QJQ45_028205, partial [Haematococcus lacustris]
MAHTFHLRRDGERATAATRVTTMLRGICQLAVGETISMLRSAAPNPLVHHKALKVAEQLTALGQSQLLDLGLLALYQRVVQHSSANGGTWRQTHHDLAILLNHLPDGGLPHAEEDILATDLDESVLSIAVAPLFGTKYLEKAHAEGKPAGKVSAIMYGSKIRPMANLTVSRQGCPVVWAPFLLDTGSATTVLNEGTLAAIGVKDVIPESVNVRVHGLSINTSLAAGHVHGINIIGANYLRKANAFLALDYHADDCYL